MSILYDFSKSLKIEEIPLPVITSGTDNLGGGVYRLRAGTPIGHVTVDEVTAWAIANTSDAECVVFEDYVFITTNPIQPKLVKCVTAGYVDLESAEDASGIEYSDDAKTALETAGIILVDGVLETGGGASGLKVSVTQQTVEAKTSGAKVTDEETYYVMDKTAEQIYGALESGIMPVFLQEDSKAGTLAVCPLDNYGFKSGHGYVFGLALAGETINFLAVSGSDYPDTATSFPE